MMLTSLEWTLLIIASMLIGITKTGVPGVGIFSIATAAIVFPAKQSTGIILPLLIVGDIFAVTYYRRHAVWKHLVPLLPWAMAGVVIGHQFMRLIDSSQLQPIIGIIVLLVLGLNFWRLRRRTDETKIPSHWSFAAGAGLAAGVTTMMANAAGPIMIVYLLAMGLPKKEFIGTGAWYFLLINLIKIPFSGSLGLIDAQSLKLDLMLAPFVLLGALSGVYILKVLPQKRFAQVVQILTVLAALKLIF